MDTTAADAAVQAFIDALSVTERAELHADAKRELEQEIRAAQLRQAFLHSRVRALEPQSSE